MWRMRVSAMISDSATYCSRNVDKFLIGDGVGEYFRAQPQSQMSVLPSASYVTLGNFLCLSALWFPQL